MLLSLFSSFFITVVLILVHTGRVCGQTSDSCDWVGSGLLHDDPRDVQPLYLRCTQGRIRWLYPRGALRALLRPPLPQFRGCVRVWGGSRGARLYVEGDGRLFPLFREDDGREGAERCFVSRKGQAALYLEADPPLQPLRRDAVDFSYDLVPQWNLTHDQEECRPCTDDEILLAYCTSDFVVEGTVSSLNQDETSQTSQLNVRTTAVLRADSHHKQWSKDKYLTLHRPLRCGTKAGQGAFLFLGRWRLGRPHITCAPRLSYWKEIRRKALARNSNLCRLD